jgi:hypothetical protein
MNMPDFDIRIAILLESRDSNSAPRRGGAAKSVRWLHGTYLQFWLFDDTL